MRPLPRPIPAVLFAVLGAAWLAQSADAWRAVRHNQNGRDFATYHYAAQVALSGGDPYDTRALGKAARAERTRKSVHPYFYPPPFLLSMAWVGPLSLGTAYALWFWLNQVFLGATLAVLRRWLRAPWLLLIGIAALYTPLPDNLKMGQANLLVGLFAVFGLWRSGGVAVGAAAMSKMAPALYLGAWIARGQWRPTLAACATAVGLTLLSLPLVGLEPQLRFYTEVLPGFSSGSYHGLTVPITLPANHSIPDLFNQLWPGPDKHHLSPAAAAGSRVTTLALLGGLLWVIRRAQGELAVACGLAALSVLMLITPVYTYEHHLSLMVFPLAASGTALLQGRLAPGWWAPWVFGAFFSGWPLSWMRALKKAAPPLEWLVQESKFAGLLAVAVVCVAAALRPPSAQGAA